MCRLFAKQGACIAVVGNVQEEVHSTAQSLQDASKTGGYPAAIYKGYRVDVTSAAQIAALMDAIKTDFANGPPLSVLVNSAGITRDSLLLKQTEEEFDSVLAVNLKVHDKGGRGVGTRVIHVLFHYQGTFLMTQAVARQMHNTKGIGGSIINISSIVGKVSTVVWLCA